MANICFSLLTITRNAHHEQTPLNPKSSDLPALKQRLKDLAYDGCYQDIQDETLEVECGHRWRPPFDDLLALSQKYHLDIRCLYDEPGCCFMGVWKAENGTITQDDCVNY